MSLGSYLQLETRFKRILLLKGVIQILQWDAEVAMPKGSARVRSEQLAALEGETHALLTDGKTGRWLARAEPAFHRLDEWQQANFKLMRRMWVNASCLGKSLISELGKTGAEAEGVWLRARQENNFSIFIPHLEKTLGLIRQKSEALAEKLGCTPYEALLDEYDPGLRSREIELQFGPLKKQLPSIIQLILEKQVGREPRPFSSKVSIGLQKRLARRLMKRLGFPFHQGRLDTSEHPFTEGPPGDIRITTRYEPGNFLAGLMGVLHETGHALYDFGLPPLWIHQPVGRDAGMSVHEGQALFWEMMVGRSKPFMEYIAPVLRKVYGVSGPEWTDENIFKSATWVHPGHNRMSADEVTYGAHILVRHDLEKSLLYGRLKVKDLPDAWDDRMQKDLGLRSPGPANGCLQDIHWGQGYFGYFSSYLLGAMTAAQFHQAMIQSNPDIISEVSSGQFKSILDWLRKNIHEQGARFSGQELLTRVTGRKLQAAPYLNYLRNKYLE